ncbi:hypothetical protein MLD38_036990 [Melastoma candidum]|uniref:Uncharacterized protein n=1 Tax=Melastoma candidum TaxID=119954 RepID=A0ACB9LMK9_9MYRT|nr:hypothetical protein MLD38_036990 [Melastoma candidum]
MKQVKPWKHLLQRKNPCFDLGICDFKMKQLPFMVVICIVMLFIVYRTTKYQYREAEMESKLNPFGAVKETQPFSWSLRNLPRGIIQARSDLEMRPLWSSSSQRSKVDSRSDEIEESSYHYLLAMPVGIKQKKNVDAVVRKFLPANFTVMLFHYDGKADAWGDLDWSSKAIHVIALNQTKWWFAKRFLHPNVVDKYDYIFLWDEDLGVKNFDPARYLRIVRSEQLEISQPALHPNSTDIHHRITVRARSKKFHTRVYDARGSTKCTNTSWGPPCTGFVEGMAPVFSRAAWFCTWHLLQNDLVHGWGMDIKLGYCSQGDRTKNVGVVDSEYIVHQGIQTLGGNGPPGRKASSIEDVIKRRIPSGMDPRAEIRRQSTWELRVFKDRWNKAVEMDKDWVDPFPKHAQQTDERG